MPLPGLNKKMGLIIIKRYSLLHLLFIEHLLYTKHCAADNGYEKSYGDPGPRETMAYKRSPTVKEPTARPYSSITSAIMDQNSPIGANPKAPTHWATT